MMYLKYNSSIKDIISLHELASKFAHTWACIFFYFHIASIYDLYQRIAFFLGFSTES